MPRRIVPITHEFPYHIVARSNNKERFNIPVEHCWAIFATLLLKLHERFGFKIHAFVLMKNHYHLVATTSQKHPLPRVMEWFQRGANRAINSEAGRINHLFGGPYKASLIGSELYYLNVIKYVYQNPVAAGLVDKVEDYRFSTLRKSKIPVTALSSNIGDFLPEEREALLVYLNQRFSFEAFEVIRKAVRRTECKFSDSVSRKVACEFFL